MYSSICLYGSVFAIRSGMMKQTLAVGLPSPCASSGNGFFRRNTKLRSSMATSSFSDASMRCAKPSRFIQRWIDATQSAARTGEPSWNFRPSRRRKRQVRPPSSIAWPSTICGLRRQGAVPAVQRVPDHVAEIAGHRGGGPDRIGVLQIAFRDELQRLGRGLRDRRARQVGGCQQLRRPPPARRVVSSVSSPRFGSGLWGRFRKAQGVPCPQRFLAAARIRPRNRRNCSGFARSML